MRLTEKEAFPYIGALPLASITAPLVLDVLRKVEKRGACETAKSFPSVWVRSSGTASPPAAVTITLSPTYAAPSSP